MTAVRAAVAIGVLALLGLLIWDVAKGGGGGIAASVDHGKAVGAPALTLPRTGGAGDVSLAAYRGKVVVLNFWASWCDPCKAEAPVLARGAARWRGKGVAFLGVDSQDDSGAALAWMRKHGVAYPVGHDGSGDQMRRWGVTGFPETFFVDRDGRVVPPHYAGPVTAATLDAGIRKALAS